MRTLLSLLFILFVITPFVLIGVALIDRVPGPIRTHTILMELMLVFMLILFNADAILTFFKEHF